MCVEKKRRIWFLVDMVALGTVRRITGARATLSEKKNETDHPWRDGNMCAIIIHNNIWVGAVYTYTRRISAHPSKVKLGWNFKEIFEFFS